MSAGAYGIVAVDPSTPGAIICGSCGKAWVEDITPAGRCPWEGDHAETVDEVEAPLALVGILDFYEARDGASDSLSLTHTTCGQVICTIDADDTLSVLMAVALNHEEMC